MIEITELRDTDAPLLKNFAPEDWHLDLQALLAFHRGHDYYYPIVARADGAIAGFANGIRHGTVGWLGNIIVPPDFRRQGIGTALTDHLIDYFKSKGCTTQLLIASAMGERIYERAGFKTTGTYQFYKVELSGKGLAETRIGPIGPIGPINSLDQRATGEARPAFLQRFLSTALAFADPNPRGFYLPDYGNGLVSASDPEAGIAMLQRKLNDGKKTVVVPSANITAAEFLVNEGFRKFREVPRMVLGNEVAWHPEMIFSRGTGYAG